MLMVKFTDGKITLAQAQTAVQSLNRGDKDRVAEATKAVQQAAKEAAEEAVAKQVDEDLAEQIIEQMEEEMCEVRNLAWEMRGMCNKITMLVVSSVDITKEERLLFKALRDLLADPRWEL